MQQANISEQLSNEKSDVRAAGLAELLQSGADASPYLKEVASCINDPSESLRPLALLLLARIGPPAAEYFSMALSRKQSESFRAAAAAILAGMGPAAAATVGDLCRCLSSTDETLRNAVALALAKIGAPAAPSLRLILSLSDAAAVAAAVEALAMIGRPAEAAVPDLEALAARSLLPLQLACAAALVSLAGDPERGLPMLLNALENPDPQVRKTAVEKMAGLGPAGHSAIPNLLRCVADPDESVRAAAILALGRIRAPYARTAPEIVQRLSDTSVEVRYAAAVALAHYGAGARSALAALRACLQDPEEKVAKCVAGAIKMIEFPEA